MVEVGGVSARFETYSVPTYLEKPVLSDLLQRLQPGDVFYDIGSDRGLYACMAGTVINSSSGHVYAFEPHPARRTVLHRNVTLNGLGDSIDIREEALSDSAGTQPFGYRINPERDDGEFSAKLSCGDTLVSNGVIQPPTVVKIDVEGAELKVIRGLEENLTSRKCRAVYVELHRKITEYGGSWEAVESELASFGYDVTEIYERRNQKFIRAVK